MKKGGETVCRTKRYLMRKLRKDVQEGRICGTSGKEKRTFLVAPIELLKTCWMFIFSFFRKHIRSLAVLTEYRLFS